MIILFIICSLQGIILIEIKRNGWKCIKGYNIKDLMDIYLEGGSDIKLKCVVVLKSRKYVLRS